MKKSLLVFLFLYMGILSAPCIAQSLAGFQQNMEQFAEKHPQEKIHIHTDRDVYGAGETLWYKVYATIGLENRLSALSNIGYVELLDPLGKTVTRKIHTLFSGVGIGEMELADTLTEGSYRLRGYTQWMRNDSADYFFEKVLQIGNLRTDAIATVSKLVKDDDSWFYEMQLTPPEGQSSWPKTTVRYSVLEKDEPIDKGRTSLSPDGLLRIKVNDKNRGKRIALQVEKPDKTVVKKIIHTDPFFQENSIQFFPEGGQIVADEMNRLAFKALNPKGLGISAEITVFTSSRDTAAQLQTNALGMGSASCYIAQGETYTAEVRFADGTTGQIPIGPASSDAITLSVNASQARKIFVQANFSPSQRDEKDVYICLQHLGTVFYMAKQKASQKNLLFSIPKTNLPMGVMTVTLLNQHFVPLAERPIFLDQPDALLPATIQQDKTEYGRRENVRTTLTVGRAEDSVRMATLSAAVVNLSNHPQPESEISILSSLLLQADIRGFIENPNYYFDSEEGYKTQDIDNLLLTQAWRRIHIAQLDSIVENQPQFPPEKGLSITGYTRKIGRKAAAPEATVQLISTHNFMDFLDTTSNLDGRFVFHDLIFPDSIKFLISAKNPNGKNNIDIVVDPFSEPPNNLSRSAPLIQNDVNRRFNEPLQAGKKFYTELESKGLMESSLQIEEVVVRAQKPKASENSSNLNGPGRADQVLTADDLSSCASLEMCLAGRLMGVFFQNGAPYNTRGNEPMQIVVDGMYMEGDALAMINPADVQSVEVLRNINYTAIYGTHGGGGLLIITSKTGRDARNSGFQPRGLLALQPQGVAVSREFYKPVYQSGSTDEFTNDLRTTIHWEPALVSDEDGQATFDFYTSDEPGTYQMIIEGLDLNGRLLHRTKRFEVK